MHQQVIACTHSMWYIHPTTWCIVWYVEHIPPHHVLVGYHPVQVDASEELRWVRGQVDLRSRDLVDQPSTHPEYLDALTGDSMYTQYVVLHPTTWAYREYVGVHTPTMCSRISPVLLVGGVLSGGCHQQITTSRDLCHDTPHAQRYTHPVSVGDTTECMYILLHGVYPGM